MTLARGVVKRLVCLRCNQGMADQDALGEHLVDAHQVEPADALVESGIQQREAPAPRAEEFMSPIVCTVCGMPGHNRRTCPKGAVPPDKETAVKKTKKKRIAREDRALVLARPLSPRAIAAIQRQPGTLLPAPSGDPVQAKTAELLHLLEARIDHDSRLKALLEELPA